MSKTKQHSKKKSHKKVDSKIDKYALWLLVFAASIIPLLVRIIPVEYPMSLFSWDTGNSMFYDIYSMIKSEAIIWSGAIGLIFLSLMIFKEKRIKIKDPVVILTLIYAFGLLISTLYAAYPYVATHGFFERYESVYVLASYLIIFLVAYHLNWGEKQRAIFFNVFWGANIILSLIGIAQYFGHDPILSESLMPLITSFKLNGATLQLASTVNYKVIGQTLYHYNYVAFFATLSLPIFLSYSLYEKKIGLKIAYIVTSLMILFNLFGSSARAGLLGVAVSLVFWIIFNRHILFKNKKLAIGIFALLIISFVGFETLSGGFVTMRLKSTFATSTASHEIESVYAEGKTLYVDLIDEHQFTLTLLDYVDDHWTFESTLNSAPIDPAGVNADNRIYFSEPELSQITLYTSSRYDVDWNVLVVETGQINWPLNIVEDHLMMRNPYGHYVELNKVPYIGFKGNEKFGSGRGYIWSRTLPLILAKPITGYGADNFSAVFPQDDYLGKYYAYNTDNMVVDKAHNLFLQTAVSNGIFGLIGLLGLMFLFIIKSFKRLKSNGFKYTNVYESALITAMIGYFIAGLFNDSTVHVSPTFWVLFALTLHLITKANSIKEN